MKNDDYERIKAVIGDIYEEHADIMSHLPLDIFRIARSMGFKIIKASEKLDGNEQKSSEFQNINKNQIVFGFSFYDTKNEEFIIYLDDINANQARQRFSLAHEIGHIVLGHLDQGILDEEKAEEEANYFAGYLLCPECIGINDDIFYEIYKKPSILMPLFEIAEDTAMIQYRHINNRRCLSKNHNYKYETIIMSCLEKSVLMKIQN